VTQPLLTTAAPACPPALQVLQANPELIRTAQDNDLPFEPTYQEADGSWMAPSLNYQEKRTDWQRYIDQSIYKQE
jgi:hypothetical protein